MVSIHGNLWVLYINIFTRKDPADRTTTAQEARARCALRVVGPVRVWWELLNVPGENEQESF